MENRQQQILEEIKAMLVSLRNQVDELEARLAELQIEDLPEPEEPQVSSDEEDAMEVSLDIMEMDFTPEPEVVPEPEVAPVPEEPLLSEDLPADDDLPFFDEPAAPVAVIDAMTARQAWRTDMPGTPVRDIRSAISLNDRILFINWLFNEDPMAFQETLTSLNSMTSFDEAVNFVVAGHPEWDLESDTVYRFMMALRRRLQ